MAAAIILALTVFISLAGLWVVPRIIEWNLFRPYWFLRLRQYWTAIGSAFVHANLSHLLFNCLTFWFFAFPDRKSTRLNSSHLVISYAVFCLKKKNKKQDQHYYINTR